MSVALKLAIGSVLIYFASLSSCMADQGLSFEESTIQGNGGGLSLSYRYLLDDNLYIKSAFGKEQVPYTQSGISYSYSYSYWSGGLGWRFVEIDYKYPQNVQYDPGNPSPIVHHQLQVNGVLETHVKDVNFGVSVGINSTTKLNVGIRLVRTFN